jgi:hypothetical protein
MSAGECQVCCGAITAHVKISSCVNSSKCTVAACTHCWRKWFLDRPSCKCMDKECNTEYGRLTVAVMVGKTFQAKELKEHKERLLEEREKARLPVLQNGIRRTLTRHAIQSRVMDMRNSLRRMNEALLAMGNDDVPTRQAAVDAASEVLRQESTAPVNLVALRAELAATLQAKKVKRRRVRSPESQATNVAAAVAAVAPLEAEQGATVEPPLPPKRQRVLRCPTTTCKGYICGRARPSCGLCGQRVCVRCEVMLPSDVADEHVCDPDDLATAEELARSTRSCPGCSAPVTKVDGCNHMWCPHAGCGTAFDWLTMQIMRHGTVHNPMYYEFLEATAAARAAAPVAAAVVAPVAVAEEVVCMGDVTPRWLSTLSAARGVPQNHVTEMMAALRAASHLGDPRTFHNSIGGRRLREYTAEGIRAARSAEVDRAGTHYLLDVYTNAEWRTALQAMHKRHEKEDDVLQVRQGLYDIARETLARVNGGNSTAILAELHALREHTNDAFKRVQDAYVCIGTRINPDWTIESVRRDGTPTGGRGLRPTAHAAPTPPATSAIEEDDYMDDDESEVGFAEDFGEEEL